MSNGRFRPFIWVALLFLAQNFLDTLSNGCAPSLVLIGVIYFSTKNDARSGMLIGLFAGSLFEMYGQGVIGFYMASWAAVGAASGILATQVFQDSLPAEILLPAMALYLLNFAEILYRQIGGGDAFLWKAFILAFRPGSMAATVLASLLLFFWLKRLPARRRRVFAPLR